jgi:multimeric flavodoxin WrbA
MNILAISGSPNPNGNTAYAAKHALQCAKDFEAETRFVTLAGKEIHACIGCWNCTKDSKCIYKDDMDSIYEDIRWCDGLILASPVYFGMVSGQMKIMMDRCALLRPSYEKEMEASGKIGCGIACGGFRNGGQETTLQNIHTFLLQQNMMVISDGLGYSHAGGTIVGSAADDTLGLRTIDNATRNLIKMLRNESRKKNV